MYPGKSKTLAKNRASFHPILTSFVYLLIFLNGYSALLLISMFSYKHALNVYLSQLIQGMEASLFLSVINIAALLAILKHKRMGFYIFCISSVATVVASTYLGTPLQKAVYGMLSALLLYGFLQVGGKNKAWSQLN